MISAAAVSSRLIDTTTVPEVAIQNSRISKQTGRRGPWESKHVGKSDSLGKPDFHVLVLWQRDLSATQIVSP
jgi:hypothetical protein